MKRGTLLTLEVFDFDHTIYDGDVTIDFYLYCLKRQPLLIYYFPEQILHLLKYVLKKEEKTQFKSHFFCFLKGLKAIDLVVEEFWEVHFNKIKPWYLKKTTPYDVIISASPEFLLKSIGTRLKVYDIIASDIDPYTGLFNGVNCYGEEKVHRYKLKYPNHTINNFYSDSLSDLPLAKIAFQSCLVQGDQIKEWLIS